MEVKSGYKNTEVGVVPDDWEIKCLQDLADIRRGASPRPINSPIWYDQSSGIGWIRISDVSDSDGKYLRRTRDYLSDKGIQKSRFLSSGSLIMSICATVGMPVITKIDACYHDGFVGFTNLRLIDKFFLYYKVRELEPIFKKMGQTGSQNNLNSNLVREHIVSIPPLPEQYAIAKVLGDVDAFIAALDRLIAKKRVIKQGTMQLLLTGKTRLPGFKGEWDQKRLGKTAILKARIGWQGLTTAEYMDSGDYYLVTGTEFKNGYVDWTNCHFVDESRYRQDKTFS